MELDLTDTWVLGSDWSSGGALRLEPLDDEPLPQQLGSGERLPDEPVRFRIQERRKLGDVVGTTSLAPLVVSPRVLLVLADGGFTGWSSFPVRVEGQMSEEFTGYRGLVISGRSGPVDDTLSRRVVLPGPGGDPAPHRLGLSPEEGSWDGSDLFTPDETSFVCLTGRVRDALVGIGVVGVSFTRMSEFSTWIWNE